MIGKEDLNKYKFIVSTGCSYGVVHHSFSFEKGPRPMKEDGRNFPKLPNKLIMEDNVVSISLAVSSQGAKWQSDSIIHTTDKLLQLGVKPENIYCFVEWSEWERGTMVVPTSMLGIEQGFKSLKINPFHAEQDIKIIDKSTKDVTTRSSEGSHHKDVVTHLIENIGIGRIDCNMTIGTIGETMYVTPSQIPWHIKNWELKSKDELPDFDENQATELTLKLQYCFEEMAKKERGLYLEDLLDSYINYIYLTQLYFKQNNIEYNFTSINTQLCGFKLDKKMGTLRWERNNTDIEEEDEDGLVKLKNNPSKYISKENDIENIVKAIAWKVNLIDLDKFNFHNCSRWRRGGIDNYLLDKLGPAVYCRPYEMNNKKENDIWETLKIDLNKVPNQQERRFATKHQLPTVVLGNHPNEFLYCFVWDRFAKDCKFLQFNKSFLEEIERQYHEDYNSDKPTINGITIGKKWMNRWKEKIGEERHHLTSLI